jgi:hypothetical protein
MCTKEVKIVNIGCQNGWDMKNPPAEYTKHLKCCGEEYETKYFLGSPDKFEIRKYRKNTLAQRNLGHCYNEYTCTECGIQFTVDSSD